MKNSEKIDLALKVMYELEGAGVGADVYQPVALIAIETILQYKGREEQDDA